MIDREEYRKAERDLPGGDDAAGLRVVATLTIRLHANKALSIEGPIADKKWCRKVLDEAWNAINRTQPTLITPGSDVDSRPKENYLAP